MEPRPPTPSASASGAGPLRVLLVGGTSAGHLAPMVAVAEALESIEPGIALTFVCSDRAIDTSFLTMEHRPHSTLPVARGPFAFLRAFGASRTILSREQPDVIFSKGSVVSVPLCLAARAKGIPVVLHESDAVMGRANKVLSIIATKTLLGTEIGNPIRNRITKGSKEEGLRIAGFDGRKPVVLVMGGSQGALSINEAIGAHLDRLLQACDVIHLTGAGKSVAAPRPGYHATEFGSDVLPHLYAATDLAVSRAGAGSIAELSACGIPAILIPIKGLAGDHQVKNADLAEKTNGFIVLQQHAIDSLPSLVIETLSTPGTLQTMRDATRYAARPEAARLVAETVLQSVAREKARA